MKQERVALVTGGNRGLGLAACRELAKLHYHVILTGRHSQQGEEKAAELRQEGFSVHFFPLDVMLISGVEALYQYIESKWHRLDVLVNNAAILLDRTFIAPDQALPIHVEQLQKTLQTNVVGPFALCERFGPLMVKNQYGRIVNISSSLGQLSLMRDGYDTYSISKAAINAVTRVFASKFKESNVLVNSVCPGWVKTDMGGPNADRSIEEGVKGIIWAATLPDGGPTGGFYRDGQPIDW